MGFRGARVIKAAREGKSSRPLPSRVAIWAQTLFALAMMFILAWLTAGTFDAHLFEMPLLSLRDGLLAAGALAACFILRALLRWARTEHERRQLFVFVLAPRTPLEWLLFAMTAMAAGVAEEAAYRGVGQWILWYSLGNPWVAALICSLAFAMAHWTQGGRAER
jgi:membrane protease YdiL (CAAX protease family)